MSQTFKADPKNVENLVKRMFWLAWQACGGPMGMGAFQDNPGATEDAVFANVLSRGDYPGNTNRDKGDAYGDYVFGRMMKLSVKFGRDTVSIRTDETDISYNAWAGKYPTYRSLLDAAAESLGIEIAEEQAA
jgi:hypothetical protein